MANNKEINAAFDKVDFDFYEAFTQNELIYISQAMEEYASMKCVEGDKEIEKLKGLISSVCNHEYHKSTGIKGMLVCGKCGKYKPEGA